MQVRVQLHILKKHSIAVILFDIVDLFLAVAINDDFSSVVAEHLAKPGAPASASNYYRFHMTHLTSFSCDDPDGRALKAKGLTQTVLDEALIAEMQQFRVVDKQYDGRRADADLRRIIDLQPACR